MERIGHSPTVRKVLGGSLLFAVIALGFRLLVVGYYYSWQAVSYQLSVNLGSTLWMFVGGLLLGAIPLFLFFRWRLVTPLVVVGGLFLVGGVRMMWEYSSLDGAIPNPAFNFLEGYLFFWIIPLTIAILIGAIEYFVRKRYRGASTPTLT